MERVKTACIAAGILILASMADANSCTGESLAEQEASRRVEITVLASGKPLWQAKVELFEYKMVTANRWFLTEERTLRTALFADARGEVRSPKLPPGHYHVVASRGKNHSSDPYVSGNDLVADLYLVVSPHSTTKKSTFSMQLIPRCTMPPPAPPQWSQVVEQMRVKDRVLAFSGTVYDQSGAPIPGVSIRVIRKGTQGKEQVAELESDAHGRFGAQLPEGLYIAFFFSTVFMNTIVPFEVTKEASGDMRVMLMVRSTT